MNAAEVKKSFVLALSEGLDKPLGIQGFVRGRNSLVFVRKGPGFRQEFDVGVASNPPYKTGAIAHIYPFLRISILGLADVVSKMMGKDLMKIGGEPALVMNRPLDQFDQRDESRKWYVENITQIPLLLNEVLESFLLHGLPVLNKYQSLESIVGCYESGENLRSHESWYVYVAAAYLALNKKSESLRVLESSYSLPGLRKKYKSAFDNFNLM